MAYISVGNVTLDPVEPISACKDREAYINIHDETEDFTKFACVIEKKPSSCADDKMTIFFLYFWLLFI